MSTSPKRAAIAPSPALPSPVLEPFPYQAVPADLLRPVAGNAFGASAGESGGANSAEAIAREAQVFAQGRLQGQAEARKAFEDQLAKEREGLGAALAQFTRDRAAYFQKVEAEVVELALAIARKILHREAQVDPLLLAGIVRVALEKIEGATSVMLRVHPQNATDWRRHLTTHLEPAAVPEIVEDASLGPDVCILETSMGQSDIGLEIQFKEIERGLLDLLAARPGTQP